eukprot:TRINITY_DN3871_c0_g1_i1.p1 TRINITY_DN3871_c0_g1~~TRINITY_DN3871_c0_g1_i1.p1  ORF type:complete len:625 (+),score=378.50 TRINITY_DN3871_c0_g1_i1:45-1919(+)
MAAQWTWGEPTGPDAEAVAKLSAANKWVVECMGSTFENALLRWMPNAGERENDSVGPNSPTASEMDGSLDGGAAKKKKGPKKDTKQKATKLTEQELEGDHYEVLGLVEEEWEATDDQIAKAYKKKCLEHHPDKTGGDDTMFKKVQVAGDVMMNVAKRRTYDSSLPFDDSIPPAKVAADRFYQTFAPVFKRNSKWCTLGKDAPPALGDDDTPMETVDAFYTFWLDFKSWRDYSFTAAEHDLETAEYREERRWMERENQRAVDKAKKAEMARLIQLVERAYKADPRIRRRDAAAEQEKEAKRKAKAEEEERKKREAEEEKERAEKEAAQAKLNHKEKKALEKKARQSIRKQVRDYDGYGDEDITMADVDWLLTKMSLFQMTTMSEELQQYAADRIECRTFVYGEIEKMEATEKETRKGQKIGDEEAQKKVEVLTTQEKEWTAEELLDLQKACVKYPSGTVDRWAKLSEFMLDKKSPAECLKKVKKLEAEFRTPQQTTGGGMKDMMTCKTVLPAVQKKETEKIDQSWNTDDGPQRKFKEGEAGGDKKLADKDLAAPKEKDEKHIDPAKQDVAEVWSATEQKALENALRDLKAYKDSDKWDKIAARVKTKTRKQCVARYKFLSGAVKK